MQFCERCKSMLVPISGKLKCRKCNFECKINENDSIVSKSSISDREVTIIEGDIDQGFPTIDVLCPECNNKKAYWWLRQLRSADESETRFFKCTKCSFTWREYD